MGVRIAARGARACAAAALEASYAQALLDHRSCGADSLQQNSGSILQVLCAAANASAISTSWAT